MSGLIIGQRWVSSSEPELGLGIVVDVIIGRVTLLFLACEEQRVYASDNCPLTRVQFRRGDKIETVDSLEAEVLSFVTEAGLIHYQVMTTHSGEMKIIEEMELSHHLQFNKPQDRLFMGQAEVGRWFSLRYETWLHLQRLQQSDVQGLLSMRASLIPHQLYIAHEAARRDRVRVMLADEVGLGKTIEAGLILQYRLHTGLSSRVMIIVPDSLLHQWLVEMLRRFNLSFTLLDEARCLAFEQENPFLSTQLVLCSLSLFENNELRQQQASNVDWDMLVVDEAHHLQWNAEEASEAYLFVECLAKKIEGLILLTATPEQLGKQTHFAQLRLLDADKFYSYAEFLKEEKAFEPIAQLAESLVEGRLLTGEEKTELAHLVDKNLLNHLESNTPEIINQLIDRHGTGRVLFRNSRHVVKGFPERKVHGYSLVPEHDEQATEAHLQWLLGYLNANPNEQALLICKQAETVIQLQKCLRDKYAINASAFHEGMSIVERDRAAAYFADDDTNVQLLLCSEIGSEGRNFQFVHHLILWDLPDNPDLLQQRIGRLDRIGQKHVIQIHVPYIKGSKQHSLYRWYAEGLALFQKNSNAASEVYSLQSALLIEVCASQDQHGLESLVVATKKLSSAIEAKMHQSRDILLELNSFRPESAQQLVESIQQVSQPHALWGYLEEVFDCFGIDSEYHSKDCAILRVDELQRVSHFPCVPEDGVTVTIDRSIALAREDMQYLTWEHPMLVDVMDMVVSDNVGNAAVSVVKHEELKAGVYLLECLFLIECSAPAKLQLNRFLPVTPIRILIDQESEELSDYFLHEDLIELENDIDGEQMTAFIVDQHKEINALLAQAEGHAEIAMQDIIAEANSLMLKTLAREIKRLEALSAVNTSIKAEDLQALKDKAISGHGYISDAKLRLDAVRFIISS